MVLLIICTIVFLVCGCILVSEGLKAKDTLLAASGFVTIFVVILAVIALLFMGGVFRFA